MRSEDILAQIDSTLDDWTVSDDAMRSQPPAERETVGPRLWIAPSRTGPSDDGWEEVGHLGSIDFHIEPPRIDPEFQQRWQELQDYLVRAAAERARWAQQVMEAFIPRVEEAGQAIAKYTEIIEEMTPPLPPGRRRDRPAWQSPYGPPQRRR
ncbi:hypothetical protein TPA0906_66240 [Streptomyces olivaceus]|uniref:hypothetical protein n=1 Tax=Streptomyces olivaceus TaxID=47716 RepID=UPI0022EF0C47|nr:hypothetical protein [Streptomyces olivaceus]GHJ04759.1 hypothetical protein TPA0906_66240 [Streptomyces olivaceus]